MGLNDQVSAERVHIGFFGRRNAGKSSLINAIAGQTVSVVSPVCGTTTDTVEKAAMLMLDNKFGGLPVVEESGRLVGIISDQDVFKALVSITGVREGGIQLGIEIANQPGAMKPVFDLLRAHGARILSVLSANNQEGNRKVFLRLREMENREAEEAVIADVREHAHLLYWARNEVHLV